MSDEYTEEVPVTTPENETPEVEAEVVEAPEAEAAEAEVVEETSAPVVAPSLRRSSGVMRR